MLCWKKKKKEKLEAVSLLLLGIFYFVSTALSQSAQLLRFCFSHCWDEWNIILAFGAKNTIQAVPHMNVCTDLQIPGVPTRNLAYKMHIFNLKQMKWTLCHVYRAASVSPVQWSTSDCAAESWKHCCDNLLVIFPNHRMWHVTCYTTNFDDVIYPKPMLMFTNF